MRRQLVRAVASGWCSLAGLVLLSTSVRATSIQVVVDPPSIRLRGPAARQTLLVHRKTTEGRLIDLTSQAKYRSLQPRVATVTRRGVVQAGADGSTSIVVEVIGRRYTLPVRVEDTHKPRRWHFEKDILPLLSRHGCNSSGCHGKAEGQNGFKLSVFGFDPRADHVALTQESRGRRVFPTAPEHSLLLRKASGGAAHGGGVPLRRHSLDYQTLRDWIAAGAPFGSGEVPRVQRLEVQPGERLLTMKARQQLRVMAHFSDGQEIDVTAHARFQSNHEGLAQVDEHGLVTVGEMPGEVAIMASYLGAVDLFRGIVPRAEKLTQPIQLAQKNFIDRLVLDRLRKLNIRPSPPADDATFLRRVYLDIIGTLPTAKEARKFLTDRRSNRRSLLIEELLQRPEFADYWALKWADLLRVDRGALGHKSAYAYYRWIRKSFANNKPLDRFARELITAEGPLGSQGAGHFFQVVRKPGEAASTLSQVFLGVRIACAQCHHHPHDRWSQTDYHGMQAFFTQVRVRKTPRGPVLVSAGDPKTKHPRTGKVIHAHALGSTMPEQSPEGDRRQVLAHWMTAPTNPWFARNLANRTWAHFLGRGLVEPVDDFRSTNPPSNARLLDALAQHLVNQKFDFRALVRIITNSQVYQLSSTPNATNKRDELNYSRALLRRPDAEVLLDMLCQTTGVPEKFPGTPAGYRAIQLWDSKVPHDFLTKFGRPARASACECERNHGASVAQVLHFLNSKRVHSKLTHEAGRVARLVCTHREDAPLVEELYLTFYSRFPATQERTFALKYLHKHRARRRQAAEDLAWGLLNSLEFVFNH